MASGLALSLSMGITLRLMPNTEASIWEPVSMVMAWIPVMLLVAGLAAILGAYDLLVIVTCVVLALLYFGANYAMAISIFLPDDGHTMYDVCGAFPPFDYADQLWLLLRALAWALAAAAAGIALKRWIMHARRKVASANITASESRRLWRGMAVDLGLLTLTITVVLAFDLRNQLRLGSPVFLTADTARILDAPTSTPAAREDALEKMQRFSDKFHPDDVRGAVAMLQRELSAQPVPVNLAVAELLILFHDDSGVPALKDALAHASEPGAVSPPGGWADVISRLESAHVPIGASAILPLMASPDAMTRQEAARALRSIMSLHQEHMSRFVLGWNPKMNVAAVTRAMIAALDDGDQMVRYFAVCTLMEINDNPHYPAVFLFKENESAYVDGWKAWAKQGQPVPAGL